MIHYCRYLFVKMKVVNYSELHFSEVTFYRIHTLEAQADAFSHLKKRHIIFCCTKRTCLLDSKVKNFAANICIEGDCSQLGACSKSLCNTQENFIDMASDSGFTTKASMKTVQDNLVFWTHSFFSMFPF